MSVYDKEAFAERVSLAARCIASGKGLDSRSFDTCFEMNDGDAVAAALYRRAKKNPALRVALFKRLSRNTVVPAAFRARHFKVLSQHARELRARDGRRA